jgi:hypothetical protein
VVKNFAAIRAAIDLFMKRLGAIGKCGEDLDAIEDTLRSFICQLARDLGWGCSLRCRLAALDLPRVSVFPPRAHQQACTFKVTTYEDVEVCSINHPLFGPVIILSRTSQFTFGFLERHLQNFRLSAGNIGASWGCWVSGTRSRSRPIIRKLAWCRIRSSLQAGVRQTSARQ